MNNCSDTTIHQGDQYALPISLQFEDGTNSSPDYFDAVRIQIGHVIHEYPNGQLTYDGENWMFPLLSSQTALMNDQVPWQVDYWIEGVRLHTDVQYASIKPSILKNEWNIGQTGGNT